MSNPTPAAVEPLAPMPADGRRFTGERKVRLGDVNRLGRLRLDALTRYTQDVSDDDTTDAGLPASPGWVVRSTVVDQLASASLAERLTFTTFCSGLGKRWAERRLTISGDQGARYEVATVWVCVDPTSGQPHALTDDFLELYGEAAGGRKVSARLTNPKLSGQDAAELKAEYWQLRAADYDVYGHVNNAAYWALVEQWAPEAVLAAPLRARLEYGAGLSPAEGVTVARVYDGSELGLWWLDGAACDSVDASNAEALASSRLRPLASAHVWPSASAHDRPLASAHVRPSASAHVRPLAEGPY